MALIEIDGLPINSMVIFHDFPWQTVSHHQMVTSVGLELIFRISPTIKRCSYTMAFWD